MNRPPERWSTVAAAIAMVDALRTNTLLMLVPRRMRVVRAAQAPRIANWSPAWPSAIHADSYPRSSASLTHSTTSEGARPRLNPTPRRLSEKSDMKPSTHRRPPDVPLRARALPAQPNPGGRDRKGGEAPLRVGQAAAESHAEASECRHRLAPIRTSS